MFQKDKSVFLTLSASPFTKNLRINKKSPQQTDISVAHKHSFNLMTFDNSSNVAIDCKEISVESEKDTPFDRDIILETKWIELESNTLLVVALHKGLKIYNNVGTELLFSYSFPSTTNDYPENTYTNGIAALNSSIICIGSYDGSILRFIVKEGKDISLCKRSNEKNHNRSICDLTSDNKNQLVSCDDTGKICVWNFNANNFELEKKIEFMGYNGFACNCLGLFKTYLCAGYGSGHLRVFDLLNKSLICEISAHAKWITSIDVALETGLILSTSEDSFVRIWQINEEIDNIKVNHKFSQNIPNSMLFGGVFLNSNGNAFCVVAYDSVEMHVFKSN